MAAASSSRPHATVTVRGEDEGYCLPPFPSNPGDTEILRHLPPLLKCYHLGGRASVNAGFPLWDPWNIPGMPSDEEEANRREKYYVTDCPVLKSNSINPATQTGFWKPRDLGWGIPDPPSGAIGQSMFAGIKTTYDFYIGETIHKEGSKGTSWIMNVYFLIDKTSYHQIEDDLVICHVFKGNSRDDVRPRCAAQLHESPKGKEVHAQNNTALLERPAGLLATHISSNKHLSPTDHAPQLQQASMENGSLAAHHQGFQLPNHGCTQNTGESNHQAISQNNDHFNMGLLKEVVLDTDVQGVTNDTFIPLSDIEAFLLSSPNDLANGNTCMETPMEMIENDMPNGGGSSRVSAESAKNGPPVKRARTTKKSSAWGKFTKLLTKAKVVLAVCNHCYKVMTGDSSNGTSHLIRHKCQCNH